jgi:hypothetical protein
MLVLAMQLLEVQVDRIGLTYEVAQLARASSRGEAVDSELAIEGNYVCVSKTSSGLIPVTEKQCARRLGL